jgi:hypothetical protein
MTLGILKVSVELKNGEIINRKVELDDIDQYWDGGIPDQDLVADIDFEDIEDIIVEAAQ